MIKQWHTILEAPAAKTKKLCTAVPNDTKQQTGQIRTVVGSTVLKNNKRSFFVLLPTEQTRRATRYSLGVLRTARTPGSGTRSCYWTRIFVYHDSVPLSYLWQQEEEELIVLWLHASLSCIFSLRLYVRQHGPCGNAPYHKAPKTHTHIQEKTPFEMWQNGCHSTNLRNCRPFLISTGALPNLSTICVPFLGRTCL